MTLIDVRELDLATDADFGVLVVHIEKLYSELFGSDQVPSLDDVAHLAEQIRSGCPKHFAFLGSDADGEPVCFATIAESFAVFAHGFYGIINELWVRGDARSRGVGAQMLEHCQAFGRQRGWQRIDVSAPVSSAWDRSHAFYVKRGFVPTGRKLKLMLHGA